MGDDLPLDQEDGLVRDVEAARDVMRDDEARDPEALAHLLDQIVHHPARQRIEPARGLVVHEDDRLQHERARNPHPLPHSAGELARELLRDDVRIEPEVFQALKDALSLRSLLESFVCSTSGKATFSSTLIESRRAAYW